MGCGSKIEREFKRPFRKFDEERRRVIDDVVDFNKGVLSTLGEMVGLGGDDGGESAPSPAPTNVSPPPTPMNVYPNKKGKRRGTRQRFGVAQRPEELGILRLAKAGKLGEVQNPVLYQSLFG